MSETQKDLRTGSVLPVDETAMVKTLLQSLLATALVGAGLAEMVLQLQKEKEQNRSDPE